MIHTNTRIRHIKIILGVVDKSTEMVNTNRQRVQNTFKLVKAISVSSHIKISHF